MNPILMSLVTMLVIGFLFFFILFHKKGEFRECFYYAFKPNLLSEIDGNLEKDYKKSAKFALWLIITILAGFIGYISF